MFQEENFNHFTPGFLQMFGEKIPGVFHSFSRSIAKIFAGFMRVFFRSLMRLSMPYITYIQRVHEKMPPKYNGLVFEILGNIIEIFTTEFSTHLYTVCKNSWKFNVKVVFYYVFNYSSKTQVSVTTWTHVRSQLSPLKQCDHSSIVITFFLTKNFN